ncbi:hypothetical protein ABH930_005088 [Kitasatospora sp. GAS204A]|uniref:hypothetical protein n=1 Tax=unclassified Kitasatospora TaxID=2633591 RepID=UPI002475E5F3|nr:hypothetical protein [Kitasatospora sp. GAS204B]MDH6121048.1 hypothetical protein [Kitasatospora sp. GAS204B]
MTTKIRRAGGTRTFSDVILAALRIRRFTTEQDLADLAAGTTLQVTCLSSTLGTVRLLKIGKGRTIPQTAPGSLYLAADQISWQNRRTKETATVCGPFSLTRSDKKAGHPKLARFDLLAAGEQHVIIIPKADVPLITRVLEHTAAQ